MPPASGAELEGRGREDATSRDSVARASSALSVFDDEARELLASRLTIFVAVVFGMRAVTMLLLTVAQLAMGDPNPWWRNPAGHLGLLATLLVATLLAVLSRARLSIPVLRAVDVAVPLVMAGVAAPSIAILGPGAGTLTASSFETHQLKSLLLLVHLLLLRAALVPSRAGRTALVGSGAALILAAATVEVHRRQGSPIPWPQTLVASLVWSSFSVIVSTVCSAVISGLRTRVRNATRLGQYTLEDKLGEGGMGTVYRARHALLRRPTAIKVLSAERIGLAAIARFEREVQVTARLSHPNIVPVYDFGRSHAGTFYYAMEFLDGVDLQNLVAGDGPQHPGRVVRILTQAAEALAEAHAVELIHRDVKPANMILVQRAVQSDVVKLVDFGLVKDLEQGSSASESALHHIQGTPLYMAPEAIVDPKSVDARSDLYALGAVGYFLLTGVPVFDGQTTIAVLGQHAHVAPRPPSERIDAVPAKLEALVLRCLEKDPARRFQTAGDLLLALDAVDDAPAWTQADAGAWWQTRRPAQASRHPPSPHDRTLAIDLADRGAARTP